MTTQELRDALGEEDEEVRYRGLRLMNSGELPLDEQGLELVTGALSDSSWRVRKISGQLLVGPLGGEQAIFCLVELLDNQEDAAARNAAAEALVFAGPSALDALTDAMSGAGADKLKFIVDTLGTIGDARALPSLLPVLENEDPNLRAAASEACGKIGGPSAEAALVAHLNRKELLVQHSILVALVDMNARVSLSTLTPLLSERLLARPTLQLLARIDEDAAVAQISMALQDPSRGTRLAAVLALGAWRRRHDASRERLNACLANLDPGVVSSVCEEALGGAQLEVRSGALELLALKGERSLLEAVLLAAEDERLEDGALSALLAMGPSIAESLLLGLERLAPASRRVVLAALSQLGDERAVIPLVGLLELGEGEAQLEAARALGELGDARAIEPVARLLGRTDRRVAGAAVEALVRLAQQEREAVLEICRAHLDAADTRRAADVCSLLGQVGGLAELPLLEVALPHADAGVRGAALAAVAMVAGADAQETLQRALMDEDAGVRLTAVVGLSRLGGTPALESLRAAASDSELSVAAAAFEALGTLGDHASEAILLEGLGHPEAPTEPKLALAALSALHHLKAECFPEALRRAVAHPEAEIVKEAVRCCAEADFPEATSLLLDCAVHEAWDVRRAAAVALAQRADPSALAALQSLLAKEEDGMVAASMQSALRLLEARGG